MDRTQQILVNYQPCEIRKVIRFFVFFLNNNVSSIHRQLMKVYGNDVISQYDVTKYELGC